MARQAATLLLAVTETPRPRPGGEVGRYCTPARVYCTTYIGGNSAGRSEQRASHQNTSPVNNRLSPEQPGCLAELRACVCQRAATARSEIEVSMASTSYYL